MNRWREIILFVIVLYLCWGWGQAAAHTGSQQPIQLNEIMTELPTSNQEGVHSIGGEVRSGILVHAVQSDVTVAEKETSVSGKTEKIAQQFEQDTSATGRLGESGGDSHWFWYVFLAIAILGFIYFVEKMFGPGSRPERE